MVWYGVKTASIGYSGHRLDGLPDSTQGGRVIEENKSAVTMERVEQAIRQRYAPFPELSMDLLTQQLNAFRIGELRPAARTWEVMMERDGELFANASKRFADCSRLGFEIMQMEQSAAADRQQEAFKYFFDNLRATSVLEQDETGGVNLLFRQMMTAKAHRYSVHEIGLRISSAGKKEVTAEFKHCPVWFFESRKGRLGFIRNEGEVYGSPLESGEWLPAVGEGLMRQCSIGYAIKHFPLRDCLLYCSRFGLPGVHGLTDAVPGSKEWNDFMAALQAYMNDWVIATGKGAEIKLIEAGKGGTGSLPFEYPIELTNKLYAKLFRGADLATGAQKDSVGSEMQAGEKNIFLEDDAVWLEDTVYERVIRPISHYLFNAEPLVYLKINTPKPDTTDREIKSAEFLVKHKVAVSAKTARERLNWPEPDDGEELLEAAAVTPAPGTAVSDPTDPALANNAGNQTAVLQAIADDLQPLRDRFERILKIQDDALFVKKLSEFSAEIDRLKNDLTADPAAAREIESLLAGAFQRGFSKSKP